MTVKFFHDKENGIQYLKDIFRGNTHPFLIKIEVNQASLDGLKAMDGGEPAIGDTGYIIGDDEYSKTNAVLDGFYVLFDDDADMWKIFCEVCGVWYDIRKDAERMLGEAKMALEHGIIINNKDIKNAMKDHDIPPEKEKELIEYLKVNIPQWLVDNAKSFTAIGRD